MLFYWKSLLVEYIYEFMNKGERLGEELARTRNANTGFLL